ncbi:MAG: YbaB/EbfC family nucleoid-associated protein [Nitrospina sp.]|nr:YbaB/EbfC family nucleoid-associated protein [Nitrospina sp.]
MSVKDLGSIFKQAQEMQTKMADVQRDLAEKKVEVSTGGGMVKVVANGINEIISINIDDELISMNDREVLEDLLTGAINEVHRKVKDLAKEEMTRFTGGIKIPGLFP